MWVSFLSKSNYIFFDQHMYALIFTDSTDIKFIWSYVNYIFHNMIGWICHFETMNPSIGPLGV